MTDKLIADFQDIFNRFTKLPLEGVYREDLGSASLKKELLPIIREFDEKLVQTLAVIQELPDQTVVSIIDITNQLINYSSQVKNFKAEDYIRAKRPIIAAYQGYLQQLLLNTFHVTTYFNQKKVEDLTKEINELKSQSSSEEFAKAFETERKKLDAQLAFLKDKSEKDATLIQELRKTLEEQVENFRERYKETFQNAELLKQSEKLQPVLIKEERNSIVWRAIIFTLFGLIILLGFFFLYCCFDDYKCMTKSTVLQHISSKEVSTFLLLDFAKKVLLRALIIALLIYALKFSMKNYNAIKHNLWVYRHKEYCLDAARYLAEPLNQEQKDSIYEAAAKEIFIQQKTGYLNRDESKIDINLLEKIANLMKS